MGSMLLDAPTSIPVPTRNKPEPTGLGSVLPDDPTLRKFGGANCGQGRKKKADKYATEIAKSEAKIADCLPQLVDTLIWAALGEYNEIFDPATRKMVRSYFRMPDTKAIFYLIDRVMGKPHQEMAITTDSTENSVQVHLFLPDNGRRRTVDGEEFRTEIETKFAALLSDAKEVYENAYSDEDY